MNIQGFQVIEEVVRNDLFGLYRGLSSFDKKPVLLKVLNSDSAISNGKYNLTREFGILENLSIIGVPRIVELSDDSCLILQGFDGKPLRNLCGSNQLNLENFFKVAIELTTTLSEIHRCEIVLNNINPDNILYNCETNEVCFVDFNFAAKNATEIQTIKLPLLWDYALQYTSPEQTGRMNQPIDYRTDFYSLGVVFYELLTGRPPFYSDDTLELIHSHIAKKPQPPSEINPQIPEILSEIVKKLLAKTAVQRYQSALGLKADLEKCADEWMNTQHIAPFTLGEHDFSDKFDIPQTLYGREHDVKKLLSAFELVSNCSSALMLVSGYSGIGKTSLIQELYDPITEKNGYFITGKFDQFARGNPFGGLLKAFRGLVRQILTESEERLEYWHDKLTDVLGANGGVLTEVIPEIELIIGKQPEPPVLGATETLNRFQLVIQNFVGAIAQKEHPLVIFLDDLQWADSATLSLLQPLLTSLNVRHFLLLGTYRDNEVDAVHPLMRTLDALESGGIEFKRLHLEALHLPDLTHFISDTLHSEFSEVMPLSQLIWEKTNGNPFFVKQFLKTLKQEGFLEFDYSNKRWTYKIDEIASTSMTDNVIELMTQKIRKLPQKTQDILMLASCIGNEFDEQMLTVVSEQTFEEIATELEEAIEEGFILPSYNQFKFPNQQIEETTLTNAKFSFLHDRVQQAAYSLIPEEKKQTVHLTVGCLMRSLMEREQDEERIFDVANHLNLAKNLITEKDEIIKLAELNLNVGRKAKSSAAFESALEYLKTGSSLLFGQTLGFKLSTRL